MHSRPRLRLFAALAALLGALGILAWAVIPAQAQVNTGPDYYSADDTTDAYGGSGVTWNGTPSYRSGHTGAAGDTAFSIGPGGVLTVDDPTVGNFGTGDFTLHLFTRLAGGLGVSKEILSKRAVCGGGSFLDLRAGLRYGGGVYFEIQDEHNFGFHIHNHIDILDGAWHEITAIRAGNTVSLTVDSVTKVAHSNGVVNLDTPAPMRFGDGPCSAGPGRLGDTTTRATGELDEVSFGPGTNIIGPPPPRQPPPGADLVGPAVPAAPASPPSASAPAITTTAAPVTTTPETTPPETTPPETTPPSVPASTAAPAPTTEPSAAAAPPGQPARPGKQQLAAGGWQLPHGQAAAAFTSSLPSPTEVNIQLKQVAQDGFLAILLLALLSLPIGIINDTLSANTDRLAEIAARARRLRVQVIASWTRHLPLAVGLGLVAAASAFEYGFLEPSFGFDISSMALVAGLAIAFLVVSSATKLSMLFYLRAQRVSGFLKVFPAFALVGVLCVVTSRAVGLQPGLILGTLAGLGLTRELREDQEGRAAAIAVGSLLTVGVLAWVLRSPLVAVAGPAGAFLPSALDVALTAIVVAAAETLAFGLLPLSFLDGAVLFAWSKPVWVLFAGLGAFAFVHVLLHPASGAGQFTGRISFLLILLGIYFAAAISFWAWFRFRVNRDRVAQ